MSQINSSKSPWQLRILAGKTALEKIRDNGLTPADIQLVTGASGAAKWLSIHGLDRAVFSHWLKDAPHPVHLFGTSVGAWKLSAAAQSQSARALDRLKEAYIRQHYQGRPSAREITRQSLLILDQVFPDHAIDQILASPRYRIAFGTVRCRGLLGCRSLPLQGLGVATAYGLSRLDRTAQKACFDRVVFHHPEFDTGILDVSDFPTGFVPLTRENFKPALLASGSIPLYMEGITDIPGAPAGTYRDGGILDYHPALPLASGKGIILYPHFYPHLTRGWFDKYGTTGRAASPLTDQMLILAPAPEFVETLPQGRIPDRKDFERFKDRSTQRMGVWNRAVNQCRRLGDLFLEGVETGAIRDWVRPLG